MRHLPWIVLTVFVSAWSCASGFAVDAPAEVQQADATYTLLEEAYPGLASSVLVHARLADLPEGLLLRCGEVTVTEAELASVAAEAPAKVREQLNKSAFFVLEHLATPKILLALAKQDAAVIERDISKVADNELINGWINGELDSVEVSDEDVAAFYDQNKSMFGGASLDTVKAQLVPYLRQQKQQEAFRTIIESLGQKRAIEVSASWTKAQSVLSRDNPVDRARQSGKPTMVDFGRDGCGPCDMMAPILEALKTQYEGTANILFVHTGEEEILAMRYGIEAIPVQIFFDKNGAEVFRHTGFFPREEVKKKLAEMGVK